MPTFRFELLNFPYRLMYLERVIPEQRRWPCSTPRSSTDCQVFDSQLFSVYVSPFSSFHPYSVSTLQIVSVFSSSLSSSHTHTHPQYTLRTLLSSGCFERPPQTKSRKLGQKSHDTVLFFSLRIILIFRDVVATNRIIIMYLTRLLNTGSSFATLMSRIGRKRYSKSPPMNVLSSLIGPYIKNLSLVYGKIFAAQMMRIDTWHNIM